MLSGLFDEDAADAGSRVSGDHVNGASRLMRPPLPRPPIGLCGLDNLGATCYLNALLQTLHFTPEFRELLFRLGREELGDATLSGDGDNQVRHIPIQLQRLFAQLLLLNQQSCSTDMLTDSFGWTSREELQQHDVQELNRILFAAIESSLVGTSGEKLIASLYHGTLVNQIACQSCGLVSEREEDFLDVAIPVTETNGLEAGLSQLFIELELMEGQNQYHCDHCKKKVNATKGCRLKKLPDILPFALLRFQFDFTKGERYKETRKYTFPEELDMNPYCEQESSDENYFDLFSVVVHRGSTHGGHYFAYIKDVDALGQWTHPDEEEIQVPCAPESGKVDFIDCDSPVDLMRMLVEQHGGGPVSINRLCKELQEQTGVPWNKRFKRLYGPIKQFLTRTSDIFKLDGLGMVSLKTGDSSDKGNEVFKPQDRIVNGISEPQNISSESPTCVTPEPDTASNSSASRDRITLESRDQINSKSGHPIASESDDCVISSESHDTRLPGLHDNMTSLGSHDISTSVACNEEISGSRDVKEFPCSDHPLRVDSSELLPIVEDHFQAPKASEMSEYLESCEASRQNSLANGGHRVTFLPPVGHCWFSFDDLWVRPITDRILKTAYQGKESAYMLFYRRKTLLRPREALRNPLYGIPGYLVDEVCRANAVLEMDREKYDVTVNALNVNIHFGDAYKLSNGALQPNKKIGSELCAQLTIDRRKTVRDLKELIVRERLDVGLDEMCLSRARQLPSGMHLYEALEDTSKSLMDHGVLNNSHLFLWNGKTVNDHTVAVGIECEPVLLSVSYSLGEVNKTVMYHKQGYPKNTTVKQLRESLSELTGIPPGHLQLTHVKVGNMSLGVRRAVVLERSQDGKSLQELGLDNGEGLTAELQESKSSSQGSLAMAEVAKQNRMVSFIVENRCCAMSDAKAWPVFPVEVDRDETVGMLKAIILSEIEMTLPGNEVRGNCRMRGDDDARGLEPPVQEHLTVAAVGWTQGQRLVLEPGDAPLENEVVLFVSLNVKGVDKGSVELAVDRSLTISELLALSVIRLDQTGDAWHLRRTNWCGEVANMLENEEATVEQEQLRDGDYLIVEEGKLPPKGFVRLAISLCCLNNSEVKTSDGSEEVRSTVEWVTHGIKGLLSSVVGQSATVEKQSETEEISAQEHKPSISSIGDVEISKEATLAELKAQILTLPELCRCDLSSLGYLRLQELQGNPLRPARVYRRMDLTLKRHKISSSTKICCTVLKHEETLTQSAILLNIVLQRTEQSQYGPPLEIVFDAGGIPTPQGLRQCIAEKLQFPLERLVIAKHFPEKFDWVMIRGPKRQPAVMSTGKGKGKKGSRAPAPKKINLRNAPYHLKDGDSIGVQMSRDDGKDPDFSTPEDEEGRARLKAIEEEKRRQRKERRRKDELGSKAGGKRSEIGIKIFVPDYQKGTRR